MSDTTSNLGLPPINTKREHNRTDSDSEEQGYNELDHCSLQYPKVPHYEHRTEIRIVAPTTMVDMFDQIENLSLERDMFHFRCAELQEVLQSKERTLSEQKNNANNLYSQLEYYRVDNIRLNQELEELTRSKANLEAACAALQQCLDQRSKLRPNRYGGPLATGSNKGTRKCKSKKTSIRTLGIV